MKTIKMFQIVFTITVLSIIVGCSDQFTNPEFSSADISGKETVNPVTENSADNRYTAQIKLKPYKSYTFDYSNTGLKEIYAINAENITRNFDSVNRNKCQDFIIYSKSSLNDLNLVCKSSGFNYIDITIENTSSKMIDVNVVLTGLKIVTELK